MTTVRPALLCAYCRRAPAEIPGYVALLTDEFGEELYPSADAFVWAEEGTLNRKTGLFACDECYIKIGMPSSPTGWTVPDMNDMASIVGTPEQWEADQRRADNDYDQSWHDTMAEDPSWGDSR